MVTDSFPRHAQPRTGAARQTITRPPLRLIFWLVAGSVVGKAVGVLTLAFGWPLEVIWACCAVGWPEDLIILWRVTRPR